MDRIAHAFASAVATASTETTFAQLVCAVCLDTLPVTGVTVTLFTDHEYREMWCASDALASKVDAALWTVGEGPCFDAHLSDSPVLGADLCSPEHSRWPAFTPQALEAGVRAIFAFPLRAGATKFGALNLYRDTPGELSHREISEVSRFADLVAHLVLQEPANGQHSGQSTPMHSGDYSKHMRVHQATGMIMIQLNVSPQHALIRLRARAFAEERTVVEMASDVINRQARFSGAAP